MAFCSKSFQIILTAAFLISGLLLTEQVSAQAPLPKPAPAADPALEASKQAFEALPEADRIAIQDGLIWTGDYKGVSDGKFGKGTRDAINAFASRSKLPANGTLDAKGRASLAMIAKQAKDAVRFTVQTDPKTGLRLALPLKLLTKTKPLAAGTRYSSADESFFVETVTQNASVTLQDVYAGMIADQPGRKITYKVLRPDFFVVTGQSGTNAFYSRMTRGTRAGNAALNGYTITYPAAAKSNFDALSIAIANSFVPFPDASTAAASPGPSPAQTNAGVTPGDASASKSALIASGIVIAPGLILTSLPKSCGDPLIRTKKAKILKQADATGLTLLSLPDAPATAVPLQMTPPKATTEIVVLSYTPQTGAGPNANDELIGASGNIHKAELAGAWRVLAAVQNPVAGAAVLDRSGALAGLVPMEPSPRKAIAGVLPQMNHNVILAAELAAFLPEPQPKSTASLDVRTSGEITALGRSAMVAITCAR